MNKQFTKLLEQLKKMKLPKDAYAIFGSGPIGIRDIRDTHDLDIIVSDELFEEIKSDSSYINKSFEINGRSVEMYYKNGIEIYNKWGPGEWDTNKIIQSAEIIDGMPFASLDMVIKWKKIAGREKDLEDIKLIEEYMNKQSKKVLVVYYSFEGSTKNLAQGVAQGVSGDILELKPKKELSRNSNLIKYFWGGKQVFFKQKPKLEPFEVDPKDYDIIFIGTPVWSWSFAPAIRSFFSSQKLLNKKVALFCAHEGGKGKVFDDMKSELQGNEFIGEKDFIRVFDNRDRAKEEAKSWASKLLSEC